LGCSVTPSATLKETPCNQKPSTIKTKYNKNQRDFSPNSKNNNTPEEEKQCATQTTTNTNQQK